MCDPKGGLKRSVSSWSNFAKANIPFSNFKVKEVTQHQLAPLKPKIPEIPPTPPTPPPESFAEDARRKTRRRAQAGGRQSTILTGATGAAVSSAPKTLLGS